MRAKRSQKVISVSPLRRRSAASYPVWGTGSGLDDVAGVRPALRRGLRVVAERRVAVSDHRLYALGLGALDEALGVGRVAHQAVEDRAERLRRGQAHVLVDLVHDELHRGELGGGDGG